MLYFVLETIKHCLLAICLASNCCCIIPTPIAALLRKAAFCKLNTTVVHLNEPTFSKSNGGLFLLQVFISKLSISRAKDDGKQRLGKKKRRKKKKKKKKEERRKVASH